MIRRLERLGTLLPIILSLFALESHTAAGPVEERHIYVAENWRDYLRLVPLTARDQCVPLLYSEDGSDTRGIQKFAELYSGTPIPVDSAIIDEMILLRWPSTDTIVISEQNRQMGLAASAIAAAINVPLYFDSPSPEASRTRGVSHMVVIGAVLLSEVSQITRLDSLEHAVRYYNSLAEDSSLAVLAGGDDWAFLAAGAVAHYRGLLTFDPEDIRRMRLRYLAWVTRPELVTVPKVKSIYSLCCFIPGSELHDVAVGILTGLSAHDIALLMARSYFYSQLRGDWRTRFVSAAVVGPSEYSTLSKGPFDFTTLCGNAVNGDRLDSLVQSAAYVRVCAHGSQSGLRIGDNSWCPGSGIAALPPCVFVGESCNTGNIAQGDISSSIALRFISSGGVAYIGSMDIGGVGLVGEYPYAFCTPRIPLGEHVRLQNGNRMEFDAAWSRAILIGDPMFHQFENEWIEYVAHPEGDKTRVTISGIHDSVAATVSIELCDDSQISFAEAVIDGKRRRTYCRGNQVWAASMSVVRSVGGQSVLLEWPGGDGVLTLYQSRPLWVDVLGVVSGGLFGLEVIFIQLPTTVTGGTLVLGIASIIVMLIVLFRRKGVSGARLCIGGTVGVMMGLLIFMYLMPIGFLLQVEMAAAVGCGAATVTWIVPVERRGLGWVVGAAALFSAPLLIGWLLILPVSISQNLRAALVYSMLFVCVVYGTILLVARWAHRRVSQIVSKRNSKLCRSPAR